MLRRPAVAGYFYEGSEKALRRQVESFILPATERIGAIGIVVPHAGLMYSGSVAGAVYSRVELPASVVLIGPNHTGLGAGISLMPKGSWETPLGMVGIDEELAAAILARSPRIRDDSLAHLREHSLEVQLPFIQYFKQDIRIVPIQMLDVRLETCREVGQAVAGAIAEVKSALRTPHSAINDVLIVASSDMTHYESAREAREKDEKAIQEVLRLDPEGLYRTVRDLSISMCGFGPAVAMLTASKALGATRAELVTYTNSGEVSGDLEKVVGYAGIVIM
ncbi:MAG TPA: AmmeMemoRadiSam system protein B [Nitrospirota bacterium]|nr:AmmeMemoRadiSam system protein B [Nitrospirota bacterium]